MEDKLTLQEILTAIKHLEIDTDSALTFFEAQKGWGKSKTSLHDIILLCITPIENSKEKMDLLRKWMEVKPEVNKAEFARFMQISRTTVYNWSNSGMLILTKDRKHINLPKTLKFWEFLFKANLIPSL